LIDPFRKRIPYESKGVNDVTLSNSVLTDQYGNIAELDRRI